MKHVVEELLSANTHGRFVGQLRKQFNLENGEKNTRMATSYRKAASSHWSYNIQTKSQWQVIEQQIEIH